MRPRAVTAVTGAVLLAGTAACSGAGVATDAGTQPAPSASSASSTVPVMTTVPGARLSATDRDAGPVRVRYRVGGRTTTVTWPAPGAGVRWVLEGASLTVDDAPAALVAAADRLADPLGVTRRTWNQAGWVLDGVDLGGRLESDLVDGRRTGTMVVAATPGGAVRDGDAWDPCGRWPDAVTGLGTPDGPDPAPGELPIGRCSLAVRTDAVGHRATFVHLETADETGTPAGRRIFTVRPDGVAVMLHVALHGGGEEDIPPIRRLPSFEALDEAALAVVQPVVRM